MVDIPAESGWSQRAPTTPAAPCSSRGGWRHSRSTSPLSHLDRPCTRLRLGKDRVSQIIDWSPTVPDMDDKSPGSVLDEVLLLMNIEIIPVTCPAPAVLIAMAPPRLSRPGRYNGRPPRPPDQLQSSALVHASDKSLRPLVSPVFHQLWQSGRWCLSWLVTELPRQGYQPQRK